MARTKAVWGIDIGQCALKALRCTKSPEGKIEIAAFDFIEYPKILSQPEADREALIQDALTQFLERNSLKGDRVIVSVPGQSGLSKIVTLPTVDKKKFAQMVQYEAKQQIPFELDEVVWDYQPIAEQQEEGISETEVGFFAIKRDQAYRELSPFLNANIEVDAIQLAPLGIYNFAAYDLFDHDLDAPSNKGEGEDQEQVVQEERPWDVIISVGTDTSDIVATNGKHIWQRNMPLGGGHFTKHLTKSLKLTFAKAEHLKRNVEKSENPRAVVQAMRPVYNDLKVQIQRSLDFFLRLYKSAKIRKITLLGNAVKLPGLQQYLENSLKIATDKLGTFKHVENNSVLAEPVLKENLLSFSVCYGLVAQELGFGRIDTNLMPQEVITERIVTAKKPWAIVGLAATLVFSFVSFGMGYNAANKVSDEVWGSAIQKMGSASNKSKKNLGDSEAQDKVIENLKEMKEDIAASFERQLLWAELFKVVREATPTDPNRVDGTVPTPEELPFAKRPEIYIENVETQYFEKVTDWYNADIKKKHEETFPEPVGDNDEADGPKDSKEEPLTGDGWVIELTGHHFHNEDVTNRSLDYLRKTLLTNLSEGSTELPDLEGNLQSYTMKELGISHVTLVDDTGRVVPDHTIEEGAQISARRQGSGSAAGKGGGAAGGGAAGGGAAGGGASGAELQMLNEMRQQLQQSTEEGEEKKVYKVPYYGFTIQFLWQPKPLSERAKAKEEAEKVVEADSANGNEG
ncbi:MAG: type IV pilus assembly protein PilM [Pirellulaceae bacterium]|nr:type IV pilus assembly protein PilM [Pirellulaceae bacterium]